MDLKFEQWLVAERKAATDLFPVTDMWEGKRANDYIFEIDTALKLIRVFKEKHHPQASV
jgi:hypothetical protein